MNRPLFGFILLAAAWTAAAADTALYKVELIVFENLDPAALQAEEWPDDPGTPPLKHAMELDALTAPPSVPPVAAPPPGPAAAPVPAPANPTTASPAQAATVAAPPATSAAPPTAPTTPVMPAWRRLKPSELSLNGAEQKLRASGRYRPFLHIGWVQPLDSSDQGTPLHIYDGMDATQANAAPPTQSGPAPQAPQAADGSVPSSQASPNLPAAENPLHVLDGTLTLRRERFLHADVDLGFRKTVMPAPLPADSAETQPQSQPVTYYVRMTQSRRLRNDDLNYLDHPLFGVLLVVSPYSQTAAK
jgi:hypothetical protein